MAIFKPTMCTPTFESFSINDENLPIYFYCKIDSSNLQNGLKVDGYAITVYNEENEQVFPKDNKKPVENITTISALNSINVENKENLPNLNTGINGSYLKIPFIVKKKSDGISNNQILSSLGIIENGKTYKWVITLFQGAKDGIPSKEIKYYDMTLTSGQILGSYKDRIQAKYSENIYADCFIEVGKLEDENFKKIEGTNRVRISGYDYSFGYIYPQKGTDGFKDNVIGDGTGYKTDESATHFRVYRYGSNPDDMKTTNKVDICAEGIDRVWHGGVTEAEIDFGEYIGSPSLSNVTVRYTKNNVDESDETNIPAWYNKNDSLSNGVEVYFSGSGEFANRMKSINRDTRILFNLQEDTGSKPPWKTNRNGIYYLYDFSMSRKESEGSTEGNRRYDYSKTLVFQRTSDANTWGNLISKVVYVYNSFIPNLTGKNLQTNIKDEKGNFVSDITKMFGTLNETSVYFKEESPIDIYPDDDKNKTIGEILYNSIENNKLYIRPFSSIETGMKIFIPKLANVYPNGLTVNGFDKSTYGIEVNEKLVNKIVLDTQYEIRTLFRSSEENNFTVANNPSYTFHFYSVEDLKNEIILENDTLRRRNFYVRVDYEQENYISWRSYQFYLYDWTGKEISKGDKKYDGIIFEYFYGLLSGKTYSLVLSIETQDNRQYEIRKDIKIEYSEIEQIEGLEDADVKFNCDTFSTVIEFDKNIINYVLPGYDGKSVVENGSNTDPVIGGVTYESSDNKYFMRVDSTLDNIITLSEDPDNPGTYNAVIKDGYQSERKEFYWYNDDPVEGEDESGVTYSVSVDSFPENGIYYDKAVPRLSETSIGDRLKVGEDSDNEDGVFSIHSEHTIKSQFYEGEVIGCELENPSSGDITKISLVIPDMLEKQPFYNDEIFSIYNSTDTGKSERSRWHIYISDKKDQKEYSFGDMDDYDTEHNYSTSPTCIPDPPEDSSYDYVRTHGYYNNYYKNFCNVEAVLFGDKGYGYIYGKYNYYVYGPSEDTFSVNIPFVKQMIIQQENWGWNDNHTEKITFYVKENSNGDSFDQFEVRKESGTGYDSFETYGNSVVLFTDYKCKSKNFSLGEENNYLRIGMLSISEGPVMWGVNPFMTPDTEFTEDNIIWRDGDSVSEKENTLYNKTALKKMKFVQKSVPERNNLENLLFKVDMDVATDAKKAGLDGEEFKSVNNIAIKSSLVQTSYVEGDQNET